MSFAPTVDDGTGIYDYMVGPSQRGVIVTNKHEGQLPDATDFQRRRESDRNKQQKPGRHRDPNSHGLLGRIKGRRRDR